MSVAATFARDGIVVLPGFFSPEECVGANEFLDRCEQEADDRPFRNPADYAERFATRVKGWTGIDDPGALALADHERLAAVTTELLGSEFHSIYGTFAFGTPRGCSQGWHQDTASTNPREFCLNRLIYPRSIGAAQGDLFSVPGSHVMDLPSGGNEDYIEGQERIAPTAGTVVLMHSRCFHRVGPNQTDDMRFMLNCRVQPRDAPLDLTDFARFRSGTWQHSAAAPW